MLYIIGESTKVSRFKHNFYLKTEKIQFLHDPRHLARPLYRHTF